MSTPDWKRWILPFALVGLIVACDDSPTAVDDPDDTEPDPPQASVEGSVDRTTQTAGNTIARFSNPAGQSAGAAETAAVAQVRGDGTLEVLAEAEVQADGSYLVEDVPAGRSGLVVSVRDGGGQEVGRVLLHQETEADARITAAPIDAETTVQGLVVSALRVAGVPQEVISTARLAVTLRMDEATAAEVAASAQEIQAVAQGVLATEETQAQTIVQTGSQIDGEALGQAMLEAAVEHDRRRHQGMSRDEALETFVQATLDALAEAGISVDGQVVLTAGMTTAMDRVLGEAGSEARLGLAKHGTEVNLQARERLVAQLPESALRDQSAGGLAEARAGVQASASIAELVTALDQSAQATEGALMEMILGSLPEQIPDEVRANIEARLETAFARADLSAEMGAAVSPEEIAQAIGEYRAGLMEAVQAFVAALPDGAALNAEATAAILIAARGGPAIG